MSKDVLRAGLFGIFVYAISKMKGLFTGEEGTLSTTTTTTVYSNVLTSPVQEPEIDPYQLDIFARTLWGEARGEGYKGMQAVANVIINRVNSKSFPNSPAAVCLQAWQFSAWNDNDPGKAAMVAVTEQDALFVQAKEIAKKAMLGNLSDITRGADHYLNESATIALRKGTLPSWVAKLDKVASIGRHTFLRS